MATITIREYKPADRNACIEVFKSNTPSFFTDGELNDFKLWLDGQDVGRTAYNNTVEEDYSVALLDGKIVGSGGFYISREQKIARLAWGMVENSLHKQGIGKALLVHRINSIENLFPGYKIRLDTTQRSFEFFQKMGFKTSGITKDFYAQGLDRYEMVLG